MMTLASVVTIRQRMWMFCDGTPGGAFEEED